MTATTEQTAATVARDLPRELVRSAAAPLACVIVLLGVLSGWVASGAAGTLTRIRLQITQAAVPMRGFTPRTAAGPATTFLTIPAHGTLTLSPLGDDIVLQNPAPYESQPAVPLTLTFRHAGTITIDAAVTAPGTP